MADTNSWIYDNATNAPSGWNVVYHSEINTPHFSAQVKAEKKDSDKVNPRLYFKYLKSKFSAIENVKFKSRMKQLEKMADEYASLGQEALSDECIKQFYIIAREAAMWACDFKLSIPVAMIEKLKYKEVKGGHLQITPLKNFARVIPDKPAKKIKVCLEKKLFDEYFVFHIDRKDVVTKKETEKERIVREKDPICFGKITGGDKYYYICDWIDELDDLQLPDILKALSLNKKDITMKPKIDNVVKKKGGV